MSYSRLSENEPAMDAERHFQNISIILMGADCIPWRGAMYPQCARGADFKIRVCSAMKQNISEIANSSS